QAPDPGRVVNLVFPQGAAHASNANDIAGLVVGSLQLNGTYSLAGSSVTLSKGLAATVPASKTSVIAFPIVLPGNVAVAASAGGEVDFTNTVSGPGGIVFAGPGTLGLDASNTYAGTTVLKAGGLKLLKETSAGTGRLELDGGVLAPFADVSKLANPVTLAGKVAFVGRKAGAELAGAVEVTKTSV